MQNAIFFACRIEGYSQADGGLAPSARIDGKRWRWPALRPFAGLKRWLLVQYLYRIALVQHAFHHDRTVNARHTFVSLRYLL